ncbi:MAG: hypothetical protein NTY06_01165 [Candidatus Gottesmanbacteria bacterium]|nr:hypothetical protein [Candidatus Gottesmanbacteria bacterium]
MIRSLFISGYFPMHDDTQVARVVVMGRALRAGQFPVRWVSDLGYGYGYPIFNFYGPLPYYVGGALYALGFTGLTATKIMMGAGLVLAGVTMYAAIADIAGVSAGILAAVFYMFAPYHAVQAYVRGAVGEYYTLIFLPLILWGFWRKKILLGAVGTAGLIVSHTILGYVGMFLEGIAVLVFSFGRMKKLWIAVLLGLGLSAFFWLPAIAEMKYTNVASQIGQGSDFRDHFVCIGQLWNSPWGFGGSAKGCLDGLSFKVGKVHLLVGFTVIISVLVGLIRQRRAKILIAVGMAIFVTSVFFMLNISEPLWDILPLSAFVQYPWRFLAFAIFGISLVVSQIVYALRPAIVRWGIVVLVAGLVLFVEAKRFTPQYTYSRAFSDFETQEDISFRVSKISDEYLPAAVRRPKTPQEVARDTIPKSDLYTVETQQMTDTYGKFGFHARESASVQINTAYFPGWHYIVNVTDTTPRVQNGLPVITIPSGESVLQMQFRDTPVRGIANIISFLSLGACIYVYDKRKKTIS